VNDKQTEQPLNSHLTYFTLLLIHNAALTSYHSRDWYWEITRQYHTVSSHAICLQQVTFILSSA